MSISISWRVVRTDGRRITGTSDDWATFERIFGHRYLRPQDADKLSAMHAATGLGQSLWGDLALALEDLPEGTEIEVRADW